MLDYLERSKKELDEIEYADDRIVQLQGTLARQEKEMLAAARTLSDGLKWSWSGFWGSCAIWR